MSPTVPVRSSAVHSPSSKSFAGVELQAVASAPNRSIAPTIFQARRAIFCVLRRWSGEPTLVAGTSAAGDPSGLLLAVPRRVIEVGAVGRVVDEAEDVVVAAVPGVLGGRQVVDEVDRVA